MNNFEFYDHLKDLTNLSLIDAKYGSGLQSIELSVISTSFSLHWSSLIKSLGINISNVKSSFVFDFDTSLTNKHLFCLNDEVAVFSYNTKTFEIISDSIQKTDNDLYKKGLFNYLKTRLIRSFLDSARLDDVLVYSDTSDISTEVELLGSIKLSFELNNNSCEIWVGIGKKAVEALDMSLKNIIYSDNTELHGSYIGVEIFSVDLTTSKLIDLVRPDAILPLANLDLSRSRVLKNGIFVSAGTPIRSGERIGIRIEDNLVENVECDNTKTRLSLCLAHELVTDQRLNDVDKVGSVLLLNDPSTLIKLVVRDEIISYGSLVVIDEEFFIKVVEK